MTKLTCLKGNNRGDEFAIHEGKNVIGRAHDCSIVLFDKKCSRHHCQIIKKGKHYSIQDLGSSNGTFLNGKAISDKPKACEIDDTVQLGRSKLQFSARPVGNLVDQAATEAAADLQKDNYGHLMKSTTRNLQHSPKPSDNGLRTLFGKLFRK